MYQLTDQQTMDIIVLRWNCKSAQEIADTVGISRKIVLRVFDDFEMPRKIERWPLWRLKQVVDMCTCWTEFRECFADAYQGARKNGHHVALKKRIEERNNELSNEAAA